VPYIYLAQSNLVSSDIWKHINSDDGLEEPKLEPFEFEFNWLPYYAIPYTDDFKVTGLATPSFIKRPIVGWQTHRHTKQIPTHGELLQKLKSALVACYEAEVSPDAIQAIWDFEIVNQTMED
jgi:hypothetical protein